MFIVLFDGITEPKPVPARLNPLVNHTQSGDMSLDIQTNNPQVAVRLFLTPEDSVQLIAQLAKNIRFKP